MFDIKTSAEIKNVNIRMEVHGDEYVRAIDVKVRAADVPFDKIGDAVPSHDWLYDGDMPIMQEIYPLKVRHKIENMAANLEYAGDGFKLTGVDCAKIVVHPKPARLADVEFTIQGSKYPDGVLDLLSTWLREEVALTITERQAKLGLVQDA
jgi:hypothetical protein